MAAKKTSAEEAREQAEEAALGSMLDGAFGAMEGIEPTTPEQPAPSGPPGPTGPPSGPPQAHPVPQDPRLALHQVRPRAHHLGHQQDRLRAHQSQKKNLQQRKNHL